MNVNTEQTTTITLTLTADEAARIMRDFDDKREPSIPGKALYSALVKARGLATGGTIREPRPMLIGERGPETIKPVEPKPCPRLDCPYVGSACPGHCSSCDQVVTSPGCQRNPATGESGHTTGDGKAAQA